MFQIKEWPLKESTKITFQKMEQNIHILLTLKMECLLLTQQNQLQ